MQDMFQLHENILKAWAAGNSSSVPIKCFSSELASASCPSPTPGALEKSGVKQIGLQFECWLPYSRLYLWQTNCILCQLVYFQNSNLLISHHEWEQCQNTLIQRWTQNYFSINHPACPSVKKNIIFNKHFLVASILQHVLYSCAQGWA